MAFLKHVGKHGDRKVCILFRQVPGEDHMALIIYPEVLPAHWQDSVQKALESDIGQTSEQLADALHRSLLPDGRPILETLHRERMIKKVRTSDIIVTPTTNASIRLDELNKMLNEMKLGDDAVKRMAQNDASRGLVDPTVKRQQEAEFKAQQAARAQTTQQPFQASQSGALDDRSLASNMLTQAQRMEAEAKGLIAEAARMKKEAEKLDPTVSRPTLSATTATVDAPKKRGRPSKAKAVADAAQ